MKKPELLAPAGAIDKLKTAIDFGADAVYIGGEEFSLRTASKNFSDKDIEEGVKYAHQRGKKVYVATNISLRNNEIDKFKKYVKKLESLGADALIISDIGAFSVARDVSNLELHVSTQANITNYEAVNAWHRLGAKRVVLARELSIDEIAEIRSKIPKEVEIEAFVHGAMCMSYSGRCLLSSYMASRDPNRGDCAQPCRWNYYLTEEKRPNEYMPIVENDEGTYIMSSKDLCLIRRIKELTEAGVASFKIEGRVKNELYVATVTKAYREAIDDFFDGKEFDESLFDGLNKVSHREYWEGFTFDSRINGQITSKTTYIGDYTIVAVVTDYDPNTKTATLSQRNKFNTGEILEIIEPDRKGFRTVKVSQIEDDKGNLIETANHAMMTVKIKIDGVKKGAILRREK